eukprot:TRINITY_DN1754_c0_g1_i3.p1 TRINITY_DN1754_c0_g1~~TRINITY_DN1754_c0_g1_i3.p1  ORF type:complete len:1050 (-),score=343.97 TRINITY_DN1754_c0_g1_i3:71-3220(-)
MWWNDGHTGAGKTYTLSELSKGSEGLVPRVVDEVFRRIESSKSSRWRVSVSYMQIYMETIQDLLSPESTSYSSSSSSYPTGASPMMQTSSSSSSSSFMSTGHAPGSPFSGGRVPFSPTVPLTPSSSYSSFQSISAQSRTRGSKRSRIPFGNLRIRERDGHTYVDGLSTHTVTSLHQVMRLLELGNRSKVVAQTHMNRESSRSHTVFTLTLTREASRGGAAETLSDGASGASVSASPSPTAPAKAQEYAMTCSKFMCVDLAGSERASKTLPEGQQFEEAKSINLSLSALGNVIAALADPSKFQSSSQSFIPWRDSRLTRLLQDVLGGNARTSLVVNIGPADANASESMTSLLFGQRAAEVRVFPIINKEIDYRALARDLQTRLDELCRHPDSHEGLVNRCQVLEEELKRKKAEAEKYRRAFVREQARADTLEKRLRLSSAMRIGDQTSSLPPSEFAESRVDQYTTKRVNASDEDIQEDFDATEKYRHDADHLFHRQDGGAVTKEKYDGDAEADADAEAHDVDDDDDDDDRNEDEAADHDHHHRHAEDEGYDEDETFESKDRRQQRIYSEHLHRGMQGKQPLTSALDDDASSSRIRLEEELRMEKASHVSLQKQIKVAEEHAESMRQQLDLAEKNSRTLEETIVFLQREIDNLRAARSEYRSRDHIERKLEEFVARMDEIGRELVSSSFPYPSSSEDDLTRDLENDPISFWNELILALHMRDRLISRLWDMVQLHEVSSKLSSSSSGSPISKGRDPTSSGFSGTGGTVSGTASGPSAMSLLPNIDLMPSRIRIRTTKEWDGIIHRLNLREMLSSDASAPVFQMTESRMTQMAQSVSEKFSVLRQQLDLYSRQVHEFDGERNTFQSKISELEKIVSMHDGVVKDVRHELRAVEKEMDDAAREKDECESVIQSLEKECKRLNMLLKEQKDENEFLEERIVQFSTKLDPSGSPGPSGSMLRATINNHRKEVQRMRTKISLLEKALYELDPSGKTILMVEHQPVMEDEDEDRALLHHFHQHHPQQHKQQQQQQKMKMESIRGKSLLSPQTSSAHQ